MFGYVAVNVRALSPAAMARYGQHYCGLCRRLGAQYGGCGRLVLSYDLTFLDILLCSLYEGEEPALQGRSRCPAHPFRPRAWEWAAPTDYCADLSVALHYYSARDHWQDDRSLRARGWMAMLAGPCQKAEQRQPRACAAIREELAALAVCEAENCQSLEEAAGHFGALMAALFDYRQDRWSPDLRALGEALGKFIYLLDAFDDLKRDEKRGSYNPLRALSQRADYQETLREALELLMAQATVAFERLPCVQDEEILRNILYSGVWQRYYALAPRGEV